MAIIPSIDPTYVTMICDVFVGLESVISDGELGALLVASGIRDVSSHASRHKRLSAALNAQQDLDRCADSLSTFLRRTSFHIGKSRGAEAQKKYIYEMNRVLSFAGLELSAEGQLQPLDPNATTFVAPDAAARAADFKGLIKARGLHPDTELICRAELFSEPGLFKPVREASSLLFEKIRSKSQLNFDGPELAEHAFAFGWNEVPLLAINDFRDDRDRGEQFAFMCLLKAHFLMFQDEVSRTYRAPWELAEDDALDILSLVSFFNRKVDGARRMR